MGERGRGPWEERAICIPNDRMTFARCIKMPLIDGARENTFGAARRRSIKPSEHGRWTTSSVGQPNLFKATDESER